MTPWHLGAVVLLPLMAAVEPGEAVDTVGTLLDFGLGGLFLFLLIKGTLRRSSEVESAEARAAAAEARAAAAEQRAAAAEERSKESEQRAAIVSEEVRTALTPEVLRLSQEAAKMVQAGAHNAEMMNQLIAALLPKVKPL